MKSVRLATVALLFLILGTTGFGLPAVSRTQPPPSEQHTADQEKLFPIVEDGKLGYINASGEIVIPPKFEHEDFQSRNLDEISFQNRFSDGRAAVQTEDGWGFIDARGEFVVKPRFERVHPFSEGLAAVCLNDLWGFVDRSGELVIDFKFANVGGFRDGVSWFCDAESGKYGAIGRNGRVVISPSFNHALIFHNGLYEIRTDGEAEGENDGNHYINQRGEVISAKFDSLSVFDWVGDQLVARKGDQYYLVGKGGTIAWGPGDLRELRARRHALHPPGTLLPVQVGDKYGFENADQKIVIPAQFDQVTDFSEGLAAVKIGEEWGFIDPTGKFVINLRFEGALPFVGGRAFVELEDEWGLVDRSGNFVVRPCFPHKPNFSSSSYFEKPRPGFPLALVEFDDENDDTRIGYVNRAGEVVWSTKY